jgi:hypothetical protein
MSKGLSRLPHAGGTKAALALGMSRNSFDQAMNQIAAEAEAANQVELRSQERRRIIAKVRRVGSFVTFTAILVCGFCYRTQLQNLSWSMFNKAQQTSKTQQIGEKTAGAVTGIEASAAKRDAALDDILDQPNKK